MNSVFDMLMMAGGGGHPVPPGPMISGTRESEWFQINFNVIEHDDTTHSVSLGNEYGLSWEWDNPSGWNIKKIVFNGIWGGGTTITLSGDWRSVTDMSSMFYGGALSAVTINSIDTSNVTDMSSMFEGCRATSITIGSIDTSNVTDMSRMFYQCNSLTTITGIENINVSSVTDMSSMFEFCSSLTQNEDNSLDLSRWRPVSAVSLNRMFYTCQFLKEVYLFNNSGTYINVNNIDYIFASCTNLVSAEIGGITCEECTEFVQCFSGCDNLETLALTNMQTIQVVSYSSNWDGFLGGVVGCSIRYKASLWNPDIVTAFSNNNWIDID